jgi:hypothetical protein
MLIDKPAIEREYSALEAIHDRYEKVAVSFDSTRLFSRGRIQPIQAWNFSHQLQQEKPFCVACSSANKKKRFFISCAWKTQVFHILLPPLKKT